MILNPNLRTAAASPIMEAQAWVDAASFAPDRPLLNLSQAAPSGGPPVALRAHLAEAMLHDETAHFYGAVLGNDDLRAEIALQWAHRYGGAIRPGQVAITAGCNQAFCAAIMSACAPGDAVMLPYPWYFNHKMWLDMAGLDCVPLPCTAAMLPDIEAARALMTPRVRAVVLVTPNNPTGAEYPDALMHAFLDLARDHGAVLIVDETYRDFHSLDGAPHGLFSRDDWGEVLIHLYSFSKVFRLTGHRTGALIAGEARVAEVEKFLDTMTICPAQTGQIAALHGLRTLAGWVATERAELLSRQQVLRAAMSDSLPDWRIHGAGAYFAWVEPPWNMPGRVLARRLVDEAGVLVLPGEMFLPADQPTRALRIAFANTHEDGIRELTTRLTAFRP